MPVPPSADPTGPVCRLPGCRRKPMRCGRKPATRIADIAVDQRRAGDPSRSAAMRRKRRSDPCRAEPGSTSAAISRIISNTRLPVSRSIRSPGRRRAGRTEIAGKGEEGHQRMRRPERQQHLASPRQVEHLAPARGGGRQQVRPPGLHLRRRVDRKGPLPALPVIARIGLADACRCQRRRARPRGRQRRAAPGSLPPVIWPTCGWSMTIRS